MHGAKLNVLHFSTSHPDLFPNTTTSLWLSIAKDSVVIYSPVGVLPKLYPITNGISKAIQRPRLHKHSRRTHIELLGAHLGVLFARSLFANAFIRSLGRIWSFPEECWKGSGLRWLHRCHGDPVGWAPQLTPRKLPALARPHAGLSVRLRIMDRQVLYTLVE